MTGDVKMWALEKRWRETCRSIGGTFPLSLWRNKTYKEQGGGRGREEEAGKGQGEKGQGWPCLRMRREMGERGPRGNMEA